MACSYSNEEIIAIVRKTGYLDDVPEDRVLKTSFEIYSTISYCFTLEQPENFTDEQFDEYIIMLLRCTKRITEKNDCKKLFPLINKSLLTNILNKHIVMDKDADAVRDDVADEYVMIMKSFTLKRLDDYDNEPMYSINHHDIGFGVASIDPIKEFMIVDIVNGMKVGDEKRFWIKSTNEIKHW